ncbi:hypothetical protein A2U01_0031563, partial [Trifolium medium]|nr:hypothetical protein [Trifolium medium]
PEACPSDDCIVWNSVIVRDVCDGIRENRQALESDLLVAGSTMWISNALWTFDQTLGGESDGVGTTLRLVKKEESGFVVTLSSTGALSVTSSPDDDGSKIKGVKSVEISWFKNVEIKFPLTSSCFDGCGSSVVRE